jgi:hypothetical protein
MALGLLDGQVLPLLLDLGTLVVPAFANDLGNLGVGEAGLLSGHARVLVRAIQHKGYQGW